MSQGFVSVLERHGSDSVMLTCHGDVQPMKAENISIRVSLTLVLRRSARLLVVSLLSEKC